MEAFVVNYVHGRRGPSSAVLVRNTDGDIALGTVWFAEVTDDPPVTGVAAQEWCQAHARKLWNGLMVAEDDGIYPGWAKHPHTEAVMLERAKENAGWD